MDIFPLFCIVCVAFTGLTSGSGVLPEQVDDAAVGEDVMFTTTLTPTDKPFINVVWKFGLNTPIITANTANITAPAYEGRITFFPSTGSLQLRNVSVNDSGEYRVSITPPAGLETESTTKLSVYEKVSGVTATVSSTDLVEFNSSVSLSCSVSSGSSLSFLWLNDTYMVNASDRVRFTDDNSTLTIVNVTRYDQKPFSCFVYNPVSNDRSDQKTFPVSYGPENVNLTVSPPGEYYADGSHITLTCSAVSEPFALFYWFVNGDKLPQTGRELKLVNVQLSQSGNYSCQAFNEKTLRYETSQPAAVSILKRISAASITPSTNEPIEGNSVNLTCDADGSVFTRKWTKGDSDVSLSGNRVFSFSSLRRDDRGEYFCRISNPVSSEKAAYTLVVNYGPEKVRIEGPSEIDLGETLTLTCSADSTPPPSYTWRLNGTDIHDSNSHEYIKDINDYSLSGRYSCEVFNTITGKKSSAVHDLTVTEPVPTSGCSGGCIAGIVIACLVVCVVAGGLAYYFLKKKKNLKTSSSANTNTRRGQDNTAYAGNQEMNYADIRFFQNKNGGTVELGVQNNGDRNSVPASSAGGTSSPPSYEDHQQRKRQAPQPDANRTQVYADIQKK